MHMLEPVVFKDGALVLIDQRLLPHETVFVTCKNETETAAAIKNMVVRGAPAIGVTAAYGMVLAIANGTDANKAAAVLKAARPTAVDLANAVDYMLTEIKQGKDAQHAAIAWHEKIKQSTRKISEYGASLLKDGTSVLLHCNAGPLATAGFGTSLGAVLEAAKTKKLSIYVDETRPRCQGSLTSYELHAAGVPHHVIVDCAAGSFFKSGRINAVMVGADRITKNGDVANKIGTYPLSVLANEHKVSFYVLAPVSTFDFSLQSGDGIKIEERSEQEVLKIRVQDIYVHGTKAYNPAFDVTPANNVTAYVTEYGIHKNVAELLMLLKR